MEADFELDIANKEPLICVTFVGATAIGVLMDVAVEDDDDDEAVTEYDVAVAFRLASTGLSQLLLLLLHCASGRKRSDSRSVSRRVVF